MKRKIVNIIVILFIISIMLTIIIIYIKKDKNIELINSEYFFDNKEKEILEDNFYDITYEKDFFQIEEFINTYFEQCKLNDAESVLKILDIDYINEENINNSNIFEKIKYSKNFKEFFAKKIYHEYDSSNEDKSIYYIDGTIWSDEYKTKEEIFIKIHKDLVEQVLYIYPQENVDLTKTSFEKIIYDEQKNFLKNYKEEIILDNDTEDETEEVTEEIEKEKEEYYERLESESENEVEEEDIEYVITDEEIAKRLYKEYIINIIYNTQDSYNILTENFKQNKFKNFNLYNKYVKQNEQRLKNGKISKYKVDYTNYGTIYSVIDSNNIYYNFYIDSNKNTFVDFKEI